MERRLARKAMEMLVPTKFGNFLCVFEPNDPDPGFTVTSPAAPGFVTYGRSLREAKKNAREGLEFHCECEFLERIVAPHRAKKAAVR